MQDYVIHFGKDQLSPAKALSLTLRNRCGSLTKGGIINRNLNLEYPPGDVIDFVLHELCHLKIKKHSHHYWDTLNRYMPNYHDKIEWLKVNGSNIL